MSGGSPAMASSRSFAPVATALRDEVIEHYERIGSHLNTPAGLRTLDTNSLLVAERGRLLIRLLAEEGSGPICGKTLLDLGAGFAALSTYFAHLGADVIAVDPYPDRMSVGASVADRHALTIRTIAAHADALPIATQSVDIVVANNVFCYMVDRRKRLAALDEVARVLVPGGWLVSRDPNRITPFDPFTGLPFVSLMPPRLATSMMRLLGRHRSHVRLTSPSAAARELRRAGFTQVRVQPIARQRLGRRFGRYHHVVARLPAAN
jgi:SAM-dependent methyltransferase